MALVELLISSELESQEKTKVATSFLTNTIRNLFFSTTSPAADQESEIDGELTQITLEEVSNHDCSGDCWIIIYDRVYDVTRFLQHVSEI